ncbi:MAG: hypothetical protein AB7F89_08220, partial [Pirellulaceae bacterium]
LVLFPVDKFRASIDEWVPLAGRRHEGTYAARFRPAASQCGVSLDSALAGRLPNRAQLPNFSRRPASATQ